jgi:hypothetical protein
MGCVHSSGFRAFRFWCEIFVDSSRFGEWCGAKEARKALISRVWTLIDNVSTWLIQLLELVSLSRDQRGIVEATEEIRISRWDFENCILAICRAATSVMSSSMFSWSATWPVGGRSFVGNGGAAAASLRPAVRNSLGKLGMVFLEIGGIGREPHPGDFAPALLVSHGVGGAVFKRLCGRHDSPKTAIEIILSHGG